MLLVPVVLCVSLSSCKSPEEKTRATLLGNWRGGVQIVGAPPVDVKMSFTSDGRYTESRSVATIPGLTGGGTWRLVGAAQITLTPASAPPASPSPAARALMPLSGTLALGVYGNDRIRIGELDLGRAPLARRGALRS